MQQIEHGIFFEDSYQGVTLGALVFSHGAIFIDAPLRAEDARSWRSAIINQRGGPNRLLVSLDAHPDRTLGTRALDCTIIAHQKTAQVFRHRSTIFKGQIMESGSVWETYNDAIGVRWAPPDITFSERMSMHWGGPEIILEYRPGPTPGSIWVVVPDSGVVFVGDLIVLSQPPFLAYADLDDWIENLNVLLTSYRGYMIISGRGGLVTVEDIRAQQKTLKDIRQGMDKLAGLNETAEATKKMVPGLVSKYKPSAEWKELFEKRLEFGLYQCFARRYRLINPLDQSDVDEEEQ